jgi:acyl-CoA synthetase (AMP-forming)/AMP-acid ligase II
MQSLMQDHQLLISSVLDHACRSHPNAEIVSRECDGSVTRTTYGGIAANARRVANVLRSLGVKAGDRVSTLAWNNRRHMELYFGVSGMGAVLHTINPRLFPEQIDYIVNHAESNVLFFDETFAPLIAKLAPAFKHIKAFVAMTPAARLPAISVPNLLCYDTLLEQASPDFEWPQFDERSPSSLCYTSGTTGNPKGVLYTHRSTVLHSLAVCSADTLSISSRETALLVVPMFHVNAWGMTYAGAMCGAKLVLPGPALDGKSTYEFIRDENVTLALGVPTIWLGLLQHVASIAPADRKPLALTRVVCGGSAVPASMIERFKSEFNATLIQAWGMTEMSPLGTVSTLMTKHESQTPEQQLRVQTKQGRAPYGVEMKLATEDGAPVPHDGKAFGRLLVRGPWILQSYYRADAPAVDADGFFDTGDIATIDADGYMQITDRSKDVIKSGGEWISSIDLENAAMGHAGVAMAAVIAVPHEKWQERPLMLVVRRPDTEATADSILDFLTSRVPRWWIPDNVVFVDTLPMTATGKVQKMQLREQYKNHH